MHHAVVVVPASLEFGGGQVIVWFLLSTENAARVSVMWAAFLYSEYTVI